MAYSAEQLEDLASRYSTEAIRLDSQGSHNEAIKLYQQAIAALSGLSEFSADQIYLLRARAYEERVRSLRLLEGTDPQLKPSNGRSRLPIERQTKVFKGGKDFIMKSKPKVSLNEVIGLDDARRALDEAIIFPSKRSDLFPLGWPRGILLYGPPGCGKTLLAAAVASEIDAVFISVDGASIMSKWLGEAEKNVAEVFDSARRDMNRTKKPVIIFVDEVDSIMGTRTQEVGGEVRVRNQFLKEMDGIDDKGTHLKLYVIGATNKPWSLDWPLLRRFQKRVYIPLPDLNSRADMLAHYCSKIDLDPIVKLSVLAKLLEGYSGSDTKDICQAAQLHVVSELFENGKDSDENAKPRQINANDFKKVLKSRRPSVSTDMIHAYEEWSEGFKAL
ncbi:MAG: AAA family ATPase [Thaumarchaeota archaeon]|nr:AAA family ATPase [Nitrososphaerota archaeon]